MLAAALLGAQGRADYIPAIITGWTHKEVSPYFSDTFYYYGKYSDTDSVSGGSVNIAADESGGDHTWRDDFVYGGYTKNGEANRNSVTMTGGTIECISSGYAEYGDAAENDVTMTGGEVRSVYGGDVREGGNATGNTVSINGAVVDLFVYGGYVNKGGNAIENDVTINDSVFGPFVYGGYVGEGGNATGNTVTINGGGEGVYSADVCGGCVDEGGNADGNTVSMTESTAFAVFGGEAVAGTAKGNVVTITDSQITAAIGGIGGITAGEGDASDNVVTLTGSQVSSFIMGAQSGSGIAAGNSVTITDSLISGSVEGARAADATDNKVTITDSQMQLAEESHILGGYATSRDATGNSVTITGTEFLGDYLPEVMGGQAVTGNAGGNSVDMTGGHVTNVYGGRGLASANENKVTLTDTQVTGQLMDSGGRAALVYGGASDEGDANGNSVILTGIQLGEPLGEEEQLQVSLFGFFGGSADIGEGNANGNTVTLTDEKSVDSIIVQIGGGAAFNANNNAVNIIGSGSSSLWDTQIWDVYGGYAGANNDSNANGNTVYIKDRDNIVDVYGGVGYNTANNTVVLENCDVDVVKGSESNGGKNSGNSVDITGGHVTNVYGGQGLASANENKVTLTNAQVDDYVYGGKSDEGDANGNTVTVTNSQVGVIAAAEGYNTVGNTAVMSGGKADSIGGGLSNGGENSGNTVIVTEGVVQYGIVGGHLWNGGELRDNRVYLVGKGATATIGGQQYTGGNGGIQAGSIAAAYVLEDGIGAPADLVSGNAIDVYGMDITAGRMYGMQILNFHIMEGLANFDTAAMVSITGTLESDRLDLTSVQLGFYAEGVEDWSAFAGKSVTLVEAAQEILGVDSGTQVDIMIDDRVVGTAALVLGGENRILSLEDIVFVPEPATGTLGLLALCALAARRRRK